MMDGFVANRGEKRKDLQNSPAPSLTLAQGLIPMADGDVLQSFKQQSGLWNDLWRERDDGKESSQCFPQPSSFERNNRSGQSCGKRGVPLRYAYEGNDSSILAASGVWRNPGTRVKIVLDQASRSAVAVAAPARKGSNQQRRSLEPPVEPHLYPDAMDYVQVDMGGGNARLKLRQVLSIICALFLLFRCIYAALHQAAPSECGGTKPSQTGEQTK
jgi:hypothetical protein